MDTGWARQHKKKYTIFFDAHENEYMEKKYNSREQNWKKCETKRDTKKSVAFNTGKKFLYWGGTKEKRTMYIQGNYMYRKKYRGRQNAIYVGSHCLMPEFRQGKKSESLKSPQVFGLCYKMFIQSKLEKNVSCSDNNLRFRAHWAAFEEFVHTGVPDTFLA